MCLYPQIYSDRDGNFIRSPPSPGRIPLSTGFDATTSTLSSGCLTITSPYGTSIHSLGFQTKKIFGCGINHSPISSLSGEVTSISSITNQTGCPFSPDSTRTTAFSKFPEDSQPPEASLPTHYNQHNEPYQPQNFEYPSVVLPKSKDDTPKASKDLPNDRTRGEKRKGEQKGTNKRVKRDKSSIKVRSRNSRGQFILERNKVAAVKCRKRKQGEESELAACEQEMEQCNGQLKKEFDDLKAEIYYLKTQLLRHTNCSCTLIHKYIAHEARKSIDTLPPPLTPFQPKAMLAVEQQPGSNGSGVSVSLTSITHSYGNQASGLENEPPIWPDPSLMVTSSSETVLSTTMDLTQNEYIPASSKLMHWMPSIEEISYPGWIGTAASFPVIEDNAFGEGIGTYGDIVCSDLQEM
ncbi:hypothetical protein BGZ63DRAFT_409486 [Mariannaea sp. PMI_226]|nr:hypothetical protein BGZ63DRAFT_409486 [Mariannaea sp. PMI_226]